MREAFANIGPDKKKVLPSIDDELAKQAGDFKNLQELKERLKDELRHKKEHQQHLDMENQLFDFLAKVNQFDVPESSVQRQLQSLVNDAKMRLAYQGHKKEGEPHVHLFCSLPKNWRNVKGKHCSA